MVVFSWFMFDKRAVHIGWPFFLSIWFGSKRIGGPAELRL